MQSRGMQKKKNRKLKRGWAAHAMVILTKPIFATYLLYVNAVSKVISASPLVLSMHGRYHLRQAILVQRALGRQKERGAVQTADLRMREKCAKCA
jgi:hypothetical protein